MSKKTSIYSLLTFLACPWFAYGQIETSGAIVETDPPSSVEVGVFESQDNIVIFSETTDNNLSNPLNVDVSRPGLYATAQSLTPRELPQGLNVNSWFLHFDPVTDSPLIELLGTVTFKERSIVGICVTAQNLDISDTILGANGTIYPSGGLRGLEFTPQDSIELSADYKSVSVHLFTGNVVDQIRIVTKTDCPLGDVNRDGIVNLLDVSPFIEVITAGFFQLEADINQDGTVDLLDIAPFVEILTG